MLHDPTIGTSKHRPRNLGHLKKSSSESWSFETRAVKVQASHVSSFCFSSSVVVALDIFHRDTFRCLPVSNLSLRSTSACDETRLTVSSHVRWVVTVLLSNSPATLYNTNQVRTQSKAKNRRTSVQRRAYPAMSTNKERNDMQDDRLHTQHQ
jgi:hypothetical protein